MKKKLRKYQINRGYNYQAELQDKKVMLPLRNRNLDNYSRYKHTVDVKIVAKQIAKTLSNTYSSLKLDNDMLELMCEWHDVGHCPFGHAGEIQLNSLLSENDMWYFDSFFSGYKHNILSAKILLMDHPDIPWSIIDGVIKHTRVLPQNFNVTRVQNDNILKLNYIFRPRSNIKVYQKTSWKEFITQDFSSFPCCICAKHNKPIKECLKSNSHIELCRKSFETYCCSDNNAQDSCGENITRYLLYPYNLTFEGECLHLADEITALTNDIFYYFKYVNNYHNENPTSHIVQQQIINVINQLNAIYPNYNKLYDCLIELIKGNVKDTSDPAFLFIQKFFITKIIKNNDTLFGTTIDNIQAHVSIDQSGICQPLMHFDADAKNIFSALKKSIYNLIHKDRLIMADNKLGAEALKKVFNYYYSHIDAFFNEVKDSKNIQKQLNEITERIKKITGLSIIEKIKLAQKQCPGIKDDGNKLLNAYRREIVFYIASKSEKWILDFAQVI